MVKGISNGIIRLSACYLLVFYQIAVRIQYEKRIYGKIRMNCGGFIDLAVFFKLIESCKNGLIIRQIQRYADALRA